MKKIFSFMLIAAGLLISGQVKAEGNVAKIGTTEYANMTAALNAVQDGQTITLIKNVPVGSMSAQFDIWQGQSITIDLNGFDFATDQMFRVAKGTLKITGKGTITSSHYNTSWKQGYFAFVYGSVNSADANYSNLIIDKDVVITSSNLEQDFFAVNITGFGSSDVLAKQDKLNYYTNIDSKHRCAYGAIIKIYGKLIGSANTIAINGLVNYTTGNVPEVYIYEGAVVSNVSTDAGTSAVYAAGYAKWFIYGTLTGATGLYAKAGEFEIEDATITATGAYAVPQTFGNGFNGNGDAFVCDSHGGYAGQIKVTISGDTKISATNGNAIHEVVTQGNETTNKIEVISGTFEGGSDPNAEAVNISPLGKDNKIVEVSGGTYSSNVDSYVDTNKGGVVVTTVDQDGNEVFVVTKNPTEQPVTWKTEWNNIQTTDFVKFETDFETAQKVVDINKDDTCAYLAILGNDSVTLKAGKRLVANEIALNAGSRLVVEPGAVLLVTGNKGLYSPEAESFVIKANSTQRGIFAFNPDVESNKSPFATVEYFTNAHKRNNGTYTYDIFSSPFVAGTISYMEHDKSTEVKTALQHVVDGKWKGFADRKDFRENAVPFEAIAITTNSTSKPQATYTLKGQLQGNITGKFSLKKGFNYIGNGYMAAMTIKTIMDQLKETGADVKTVMYTWNGTGYDPINTQFISESEEISSMKMFVLYANKDVDITFDYSKLIWEKYNK